MNLERWDIVVSSFSPPSPNIQPIHPPCSELELALGQAGGHVLGDSRLLRGLDRKYRGVFLLAPDHGLGSSTGGCWDKEYGGFWEDINSEIRRSPGRRSTWSHQLEWACSPALCYWKGPEQVAWYFCCIDRRLGIREALICSPRVEVEEMSSG